MSSREIAVPVPGGSLAAIDYGGTGRDVLFAHSPGFNARQWDEVAELVSTRCVSIDLPGHGHSTAPVIPGDEIWRYLVEVIDHLGLKQPLIVSHEMSGAVTLQAGRQAPERIGGLMFINGSCACSREAMVTAHALWNGTELRELLKSRFSLELPVSAPDAQTYLRDLAEKISGDWWLPEDVPLPTPVLERSMFDHHDGTYSLRPATPDISVFYSFEDTPLFPCADAFDGLELQAWLVANEGTFEPSSWSDIEALALRHSNVHARFLPGGHYPQHSTPHVIARLVDEAVAELDAAETGGRAAG